MAAGKGSLPRVTQVILLQVQRCAKLPGLPGDPCCSRGGGPQVPLPGASHSPSFLSWGPRCMEGGLDPAHQAWLSGGPVWPHFAPSGMGEKRPTIVVQLSSPTCVFPRAAPQGATPAPRRPLSWPPPRVPCFTSCLWGDTFRLCSRQLRALQLGAAPLGWLRPLPAAGRLLRCVPRAHPVPGHVLCSPPGPSSGFFPFPTLRLAVTPGCRSPEICGGGGEGENASSPAHGHEDRAPTGTGVRKPLSRVHGTRQNQGTCPSP